MRQIHQHTHTQMHACAHKLTHSHSLCLSHAIKTNIINIQIPQTATGFHWKKKGLTEKCPKN
jgi:hypothetical protein